jgi:hypothetical protein
MKVWHIDNANQLSKMVGIDYRTAVKAVNSDDTLSVIVAEKLAMFFKFGSYLEFRYYAIAYNAEVERDQA